jgi:hypothetical protein
VFQDSSGKSRTEQSGIIEAIGGKQIFVIGTCNGIKSLPLESDVDSRAARSSFDL